MARWWKDRDKRMPAGWGDAPPPRFNTDEELIGDEDVGDIAHDDEPGVDDDELPPRGVDE